MTARWTISLGASAEKLARSTRSRATRRTQFALRSHRLAARAYDDGVLPEIVRVPGVDLDAGRGDPHATPRSRSSPRCARVRRGRDGHGRQHLAAERRREHAAARRRARRARCSAAIRSRASSRSAVHGVDPDVFGIAPVEAVNKALARAGRGWDDVDVARAQRGVRIAVARLPRRLAGARPRARQRPRRRDRDRTPARRVRARVSSAALAHELHARGGGYGVATLCIGVGQGLAVILEA